MGYVFTIDIEDWFQVENLRGVYPLKSWPSCELKIENNVKILLELFAKYNIKATFFVLGWIAEKVPHLVREIQGYGHEVASHGYWHELIYKQSLKKFAEDVEKSKKILEDITGEEIKGYRAPSFTINNEAINILYEKGYIYDSSYCATPLNRKYGKLDLRNTEKKNGIYIFQNGFYEIPVSTVKFLNIQIPTGGAYFRIFPYYLFKYKFKSLNNNSNNELVVFYIHPWEIDPDQPKVKGISFIKKFKHYTNLKKNLNKLEKLIKEFSFISIKEYLKLNNFLI